MLSTTASLASAIDDINSEIMTEEVLDYVVQLKHKVPITHHPTNTDQVFSSTAVLSLTIVPLA